MLKQIRYTPHPFYFLMEFNPGRHILIFTCEHANSFEEVCYNHMAVLRLNVNDGSGAACYNNVCH